MLLTRSLVCQLWSVASRPDWRTNKFTSRVSRKWKEKIEWVIIVKRRGADTPQSHSLITVKLPRVIFSLWGTSWVPRYCEIICDTVVHYFHFQYSQRRPRLDGTHHHQLSQKIVRTSFLLMLCLWSSSQRSMMIFDVSSIKLSSSVSQEDEQKEMIIDVLN